MSTRDPLDEYIDAVSAAMSLPIREEWRQSIRANLNVTLSMARMVEQFQLPDESEPAHVYRA